MVIRTKIAYQMEEFAFLQTDVRTRFPALIVKVKKFAVGKKMFLKTTQD